MSRKCDLTGTGVQTGNNVSHANNKTRRRFLPNLQHVSVASDALKQDVSLRITMATLRSIDHNGGLDDYLLSTSSTKLTAIGRKLKTNIKKAKQAA